jgi:DNA-binding XRE family transcriptional regulator
MMTTTETILGLVREAHPMAVCFGDPERIAVAEALVASGELAHGPHDGVRGLRSYCLPDGAGNHEAPATTIGAIVRARRKELGLTIDEAAEAAGVHATSLSALERGVTEWPVWFGRLLDALGLAIVPSADNYAERLRASGLTDKGAR